MVFSLTVSPGPILYDEAAFLSRSSILRPAELDVESSVQIDHKESARRSASQHDEFRRLARHVADLSRPAEHWTIRIAARKIGFVGPLPRGPGSRDRSAFQP
jgi:hypothetical protein